ncbi:MAG: flavin reductase [Patescibacteria group bacterium]
MRKLWNRSNQAVWSVSTMDESGATNMNIATYVTAVSLEPKLMMVAVYKDTKTLENLKCSNRCLLQLLSIDLAPVVRVCGKFSGKKIDKIKRLQKRYEIREQSGLPYFALSAGYMEITIIDWLAIQGDHEIAVGEVTAHVNLNNNEVLTTNYLRKQRIIR